MDMVPARYPKPGELWLLRVDLMVKDRFFPAGTHALILDSMTPTYNNVFKIRISIGGVEDTLYTSSTYWGAADEVG